MYELRYAYSALVIRTSHDSLRDGLPLSYAVKNSKQYHSHRNAKHHPYHDSQHYTYTDINEHVYSHKAAQKNKKKRTAQNQQYTA